MTALWARLHSLMWPLLQKYFISKLFALLPQIKAWFDMVINKIKRDQELAEKLEDLKKAGTNPELTPEQKAKEIEDAGLALIDSANKPR
jgi:hypothetical protein